MDFSEVKVSVIIPTYGRPDMLKRAIESILTQTYKNLEIIVVDDNNPETVAREETEQCLSSYIDNNKVKYIKHKKNMNGAAARNTGIKNSTGEYISFLDDDDWFLPNKLETQVKHLFANSNYDAVCCGWIKKDKKYKANTQGDLIEKLLMLEYHPMTSTLMFTRKSIESLGGFNENFRRHQDYELMLRFLEHYHITQVDDCLVGIGVNDGENAPHGEDLEKIKSTFLSTFKDNILALEKQKKGITRKIYSKHYSRVFWNHVHYGFYVMAFKLLFRFLFYSPINFLKYVINYAFYVFKIKRIK